MLMSFLFSERATLAAPRTVVADMAVSGINDALGQPLLLAPCFLLHNRHFPSFLKVIFVFCQLHTVGSSSFVRQYNLAACS